MAELFKRNGKWLTREQLWEFMKKPIEQPIESTKEVEVIKVEEVLEVISDAEKDMAKCKSKKKSKK